ncbi:MAG: Pyruvate kinase [Parcubacteria group bacterium]|nr:Pyruvate kinase [Parcubacteria group bacterium]
MKTKIIATIGPNSEDAVTLSRLVLRGMDVARMNFSHCSAEEYKRRRNVLFSEADKLGKTVAVLQDLQGPRIRVGEMPKEGRELKKGEIISFTTLRNEPESIFVDEPALMKSLEVGNPIYLSSGEMELAVSEVTDRTFKAEVLRGGVLFSRKGINVPETRLLMSGLTEKDLRDVEFALAEGVEYIAVSFVQNAEDMKKLRGIVGNRAKLIAKIETAQALKNIDEIIQASDTIMVARGDLGVEIPMERVPFVQKNLIRHAHWYGKGAIVATQMLLSMVESKKPTRAEVSDIANAVLDGADALMLSDETAGGKYPLEALETMVQITKETERIFHETENLL